MPPDPQERGCAHDRDENDEGVGGDESDLDEAPEWSVTPASVSTQTELGFSLRFGEL